MSKFLKIMLIIFMACPVQLFASHGMGGEITWECLGNGQYKFRLILYRDCNGINAPTTLNLSTTVPGVPSIPMPRVQQVDISFKGYLTNGITACPTCSTAGGAPALVEKNVYESASITLTGIPPAAGWHFYWGECCRSGFVNNIPDPGNEGFRLKAVIFPYNGQNTSTCYDSSPFFVERPMIGFCTGVQQQFTYSAYDVDGDSVVYEWTPPLDDLGNPLSYASGYNLSSQLPSATQHSLNVAAVLNNQTGMVSYLGYTGGLFNMSVKATAYKCGVKVSENTREINIAINNSCPPVLGGIANRPPAIYEPFFDSSTATFSFTDTVRAGGFISFDIDIFDTTFAFSNGAPQTLKLYASGGTFGTNFTGDLTQGCEIPPCPQVAGGFATTYQIGGTANFGWQTSEAHYNNHGSGCQLPYREYKFNFKACDNYCPANACATQTITIVVTAPPVLIAPVIRCAVVNTDGSVTLHWSPSTSNDSLGLFRSYKIYASTNPNGNFQLIDSVTTGINTNTYTHSVSALTALFGTNGNLEDIYYKITTFSDYFGGEESGFSNRLGSIQLNASYGVGNSALLNWNAPSFPMLPTHETHYKIYREYPAGNWTFVDTTSNTTYGDLFTQTLCSDSVNYRVEIADSAGCTSVSLVRKFLVSSTTSAAFVTPANPSVCNGQNVILTANAGIDYLWNTNDITPSISVNQAGTYTVTVTQANGCSGQGTVTVTVEPSPVPNITGILVMCQGSNTNLNAGSGFSSYLWNTGATTQTINVNNAGTYIVTVTNPNGCTGSDTVVVVINPLPVPVIAGTFAFCQGSSTVLTALGTFATYQWSTGAATQVIIVNTQGVYTVTVTDNNGCSGTASASVSVNPLPVPVITGSLVICPGDSTTLSTSGGYTSYLWSPGNQFGGSINVTSPGTYTVTVTDNNGCTGSSSATVTAAPVPVITQNTIFCASGGSATLNAGGGYTTYLWNTGANTQTIPVSSPGTYTVTVTGFGCTLTDSITVITNPNPIPIINAIAICQGSFGNLNAGAGWSAYQWSNGGTAQVLQVSAPGIYTVTVTNAYGCTGSDTALVTVYAQPSVTATAAGNPSFCEGDSLLLSATAGYPAYLWYRNLSPLLPNITQSGFFVYNLGNYYCRVTDNNGCSNFSNVIVIPAPCIPIGPPGEKGVDEIPTLMVSVYPNPSIGSFNVISNLPLLSVSELNLYDLASRQVSCKIERVNNYEFVLSGVHPGIYILKIQDQILRIAKIE